MINDNNFFEKVFNTMPDPVLVYDLTSKQIVKVNKPMELLSDMSEQTLIGLPLGFFSSGRTGFTPDVIEKKVIDAVNGNPQTFLWEASVGSKSKLLTITISVSDDKQLLFMIVKEVFDTVEKRGIESNPYVKKLCKSVPGIFFVFNENNEMIMWNENHTTLLGYTDDELQNKHALSFFSDDDVANVVQAIEQVYELGDAHITAKLLHKSGKEIPCLLNFNKTENGFIGFGLDISELVDAKLEQETLQQQLLQSSKLEAIGKFSTIIVADLKNLICGIKGVSDVLNIKVDDFVEKDLLNTLNQACDHANDLIKQIQIFAKEENLPIVEISLNDLIEESISLFEKTVKSDTLKINYKSYRDDVVLANKTQLHQLINNICKNAYESMRDDYFNINIELATYHFKDEILKGKTNRQDYLKLTFEDNGIGMSEEVKNRIFDCFFSTKEHMGSVGLGMVSVLKIVQYWKGFISVESEEGKGTKITILVPTP